MTNAYLGVNVFYEVAMRSRRNEVLVELEIVVSVQVVRFARIACSVSQYIIFRIRCTHYLPKLVEW